jgi:hypothetical protein
MTNNRSCSKVSDNISKMERVMTAILYKEELSKLHRIPIPTLNYWRHIGYGPASFKIGAKVVYRVEDVDRWLAERYAAEHPTARAS